MNACAPRLMPDVSWIRKTRLAAGSQTGRIRSGESDCPAKWPVRFFFFSSDRDEPIHVHVKRERKLAKFWLAPVRMAYNYGFSEAELDRLAGIVRRHEAKLSKAWDEYFKRGNRSGGGQERSGY